MVKRKRSVVVFDSGIGGLNLLYECASRVKDADYYYVSDSGNMPYGNKSKQEILSLTLNALKVVEEVELSALVIACNTVTANCITELRAKYSCPVIGVQPAIKCAVQLSDNCLVLATNATVNSTAFKKLLNIYKMSGACAIGCDELARYVEDNIFNLPTVIPEGLLPKAQTDCVVLGCTHYAFIKRQISAKYGCQVIDGIGGTADHFAKILGINIHFAPHAGTVIHLGAKKPKIAFLGGNSEKNSQIFEQIYKNKRFIL